MIVDELIAVLGFDLRGEGNARRFQSRLKQLDSSLTAFAARATQVGIAVGAALGALGVALGKSVLQTAGEFEGFESRLTTLYQGNQDAAKQSLDWIEKFAVATPYDLAGVTDAFVKLKSYGIDPVANDALQTLGDTASAMGKPLMQAVEALADAMTGEMDRLKDFGIRASQAGDQVTFSWTESGKAISQTVKKNGADVQKFLLDFWQKRFGGGMVRASKTWEGMLSNLGDAWTMFKRRIATAGGEGSFFNTVKNRLAGLLDYIGELDRNGTLDRWADNVGKAFKKVFDQFPRMAKHIRTLYDNFGTFKPLLGTLGIGFVALAARAHPLIAALVAIGAVIEDILKYKEGDKSVTGRIIDAITKKGELKTIDQISKRLGELAITIPLKWAFGDPEEDKAKSESRVAKLIENTKKELSEVQKAILGQPNEIDAKFQKRFWNPVKNFLQGVDTGLDQTAFKSVNDKFRSLASTIDNAFQTVAKWNESAGQKLISSVKALANWKWDENTWNQLTFGLENAIGKIKSWFDDLKTYLENINWTEIGSKIINHIWEGMKSAFAGLSDWWKSSFESLGSVSPNPRTYSVPEAPSGSIPSNYRDAMSGGVDDYGERWIDPYAEQAKRTDDLLSLHLENASKNLARQSNIATKASTIIHNNEGARSNVNNVTVNQTVTKATDAPRRAADATAKAVSKATSTEYYNASRIELEPAVP